MSSPAGKEDKEAVDVELMDGSLSCIRQQHAQQHVRTGRHVRGLGPLMLRMAHAVAAWNEDHRARTQRRHMARVVTGGGKDVHVRLADALGRLRDGLLQSRVENVGRRVDQRRHLHLAWRSESLAQRHQAPAKQFQHGVVGVAQVDAQRGAFGHHRRRVGLHLQATNGELHHVVMPADLRIQRHRDARERFQRVTPVGHGQRAGVSALTLDDDVECLLSLDAGDHADHALLRLQDRPLLDVRLDVSRQRKAQRPPAQRRECRMQGIERIRH